jgi:signal transduction histidine kinase
MSISSASPSRPSTAPTTVALVTLGCARNEVDSEELAGRLETGGFALVDDADEAQMVVVNTCGFVEAAKKDSVDTLLAAADLKESGTTQAVVAVGCLAERYGAELAGSLPEADAVLGFDDYTDIAGRLRSIVAGETHHAHTPSDRRLLLPISPVDRQQPQSAPVVTPRSRLESGPLAPLKGYLTLIRRTGAVQDAGALEMLSQCESSAVRMGELIEALLRFNAAAFEARDLHRERTALIPLIEEQVEAQRLQWQAHGVQVQVEGEPLAITVDPAKLGTALANLLSNAIRFSERGGVIRFEVSGTAETARIDIADAGPGIAEGDRDRVFEPFYRGERQPEHAVKGTGIGLSIVQEYIAAHGGHVVLLPDGPGARFRIELPRSA